MMKPKLVILLGPHAVGKMTVGHELEKITGLKLFHNHMTIELVAPLFGYGSNSPTGTKLVELFRREIFEEFAKSDQEGLIFTYVCAFDKQSDWGYIKSLASAFDEDEVYWVELQASLDARVNRNKHEHRLQHKPSKRNVEWSKKNLIENAEQYRLNSLDGEMTEKNYIKIDNTNLSPEDVATMIIEKFSL